MFSKGQLVQIVVEGGAAARCTIALHRLTLRRSLCTLRGFPCLMHVTFVQLFWHTFSFFMRLLTIALAATCSLHCLLTLATISVPLIFPQSLWDCSSRLIFAIFFQLSFSMAMAACLFSWLSVCLLQPLVYPGRFAAQGSMSLKHSWNPWLRV